jgi:hypothetical protein
MDDPIVFPGQPGLSHHHTSVGVSYTKDAAHPIELPLLRGFVRYAVPAGKPIDLQLSSGDYTSWHVDFFEGWIPSELQRFITQCGGRECGENPS